MGGKREALSSRSTLESDKEGDKDARHRQPADRGRGRYRGTPSAFCTRFFDPGWGGMVADFGLDREAVGLRKGRGSTAHGAALSSIHHSYEWEPSSDEQPSDLQLDEDRGTVDPCGQEEGPCYCWQTLVRTTASRRLRRFGRRSFI